jgi:prepilin-type N-terminal cleavage/methylation domain-containing protein
MDRSRSKGFSMVELAITLVVLGLILAFGIPMYQSYNTTQQLKGATENVAGQMRLLRETAIGTGQPQTMHFTSGFVFNGTTSDYHIHNASVGATWRLPRGIIYFWGSGTASSYIFKSDGRLDPTTPSGIVILQDPKGNRDTVSVMSSGLILTK